ncbi:MAG: hypothetical protein HOW73_38430 [Polyangiaceae bacterium]|nr:hypothetical protein [Polyangiaceae bacterium]
MRLPYVLVLGSMLVACGARSSLEDEPSHEDPPIEPACELDDRVFGDGAWMRPLGLAGTGDGAFDVAVAPDGSIVVAAPFDGGASIDCFTLSAPDVVVLKFDPNGRLHWARQLGRSASDTMTLFAGVDVDGGVHVVGTSGHDPSIFHTILSATGELEWSLDYPADDMGIGVIDAAFDPDGTTWAVVNFQNRLEIAGQVYDGGIDDVSSELLVEWDPQGEVRSLEFFGPGEKLRQLERGANGIQVRRISRGWSSPPTVEVRRNGSVLWSQEGTQADSLMRIVGDQLVEGTRPALEDEPWVRSRAVDTGELLWESPIVVQWEGDEDQGHWPPYAASIAPVAGGWVVAASLLDSVNLGTGWVSSAGSFDGLLARLGPQGEPIAVRTIGGPGVNGIRDIAPLPDGRIVVALMSDEPIDLGFGPAGTPCAENCNQHILAVMSPPAPDAR